MQSAAGDLARMRIVAGDLKGRTLRTPDGRVTRPTSDRVRESLFNVLEHADWAPALSGARVMDLFAGSGALGFEALSRGAAFCLFVETDATARGVIRENIDALSLFGRTRLHRRDAIDLGAKPAALSDPFDLAFLDPPYRQGLGTRALGRLAEGGWLKAGAIAVLECAADEDPDPAGFAVLDFRSWGAAKVLFLKAP